MATPHKHQCQQEPTTLMSLGDDMLVDILRRLTLLSLFPRATFACKRLCNVISSCSYASVVASRIMSSAPLVGYFISVIGGATPSFHRALLGSDRDVASIVRYGKFQFADFDDYSWRLMDCRHGLLLLSSDSCMVIQCQQEPTTFMSLGDDMLTEILHRVMSLSLFPRAAFACKRLRNVISSCSYASGVASRIMSLTPLVGYFISVIGGAIPSFHRVLLGSDRDVASIILYGRFQFANFNDYSWRLMDCRHGLLLLSSDGSMAVFDPLIDKHFPIPHHEQDQP
ncbi:hypothetical protein QYE76_006950 [Lolium multiflorum]|uniref:F-box domain-containing protein n=1 Tax=Lolium multiflorum TaxID=4521 RepID=A0AAD8RWM3_LOLMU|nr:hypothetical protein QYE76_006950 [Lolium multiflorum]